MNKNAYSNYLRQEVEGASKGKIVVMLYEAAIRFLNDAIKSIEEKNVQESHNNIIRAESIIYELMSTLNTKEGGEVAENLLRLYDFIIWELVDANVSKNNSKIEGVLRLLTPLKDAWKEAVQKESAPKEPAKPAAPAKPFNVAG